jgi:SWIM zinc finger
VDFDRRRRCFPWVGQNVSVPLSDWPELPEAFAAAWSSSLVMAQAGPRVFSRGVVYQRDRRVEVVEILGSRVSAVVRGTIPYSVTIGVEDGSWVWSCACPAAEDGDMCKHVVATALAATHGDSVSLVPSVTTPPISDAATAADVAGLAHDELVALVLAQAESDWRLRVQLLARAAAATSSPIDERAWRRRIESAFAPYEDYVHYREAAGWARDVDEILQSVGDLIETHPAQAIALLEHAYGQANAAIQWIDDSDGYLTTIAADIGEFHLAACEAARPDPAELARRLVDLELTSELDAFHRAAATYAGVLGTVGLAEYRRLIEPDCNRSTADSDRSSSGNYEIREAMIGVAIASGDPDELIRVRSRSLQLPDDYLESSTCSPLPAELLRRSSGDNAASSQWPTEPGRPHRYARWLPGCCVKAVISPAPCRCSKMSSVAVRR